MQKEIKHVYIAKSCLFVNGQLVLKGENSIFVKYLKEVYKYTEIKYSKYFKMDPLSKLGFLAAEVLLKDKKCSETAELNGIVLENKVSTYLVDVKHQITINDKENYFPSPANFVYTLPNVMTGEICIRHGFKGENAVFVNDEFDAVFVCQYIKSMYKADKADMLIGGFVDADDEDYEAFVFFTEKEDANELDAKLINKLYQQSKAQAEQQ